MKLKKVLPPLAAGFLCLSALSPAQALFVAHEHANFQGAWLVHVPHGVPGVIDVADNRTSAVENYSGRNYSGRNIVGPYVSHEVFYFANNASYAHLGGANDVIDHFDIR